MLSGFGFACTGWARGSGGYGGELPPASTGGT